ncbi:MAG: class I SAM-dependent methyltransferase [Chloroflexota bacterium]
MTEHSTPRQPSYPRGDAYDENWRKLAATGQNVHGEADFVEQLGVKSVLDAGCGTGRVAIELAQRGLDVAGVDVDPAMLSVARDKAPHLEWRLADLATVDLGRTFEVVVLAGNVMIFVAPGSEEAVLRAMGQHLQPGGRLVAGFQLRPGGLTLNDYDALAVKAAFELESRWSTWDRASFEPGGNYAVSVHRLSQSRDTRLPR